MTIQYCEPGDLENRLKTSGYDNLVDDDENGSDDADEVTSNVTSAIEQASTTIAEYLANRTPPYDVSSIPSGGESWLKYCCVDIAAWYIVSNGGGEVPDSLQRAYDARIARLEKIEAGNIVPGTTIATDFDDNSKTPYFEVQEYIP